MRMMRTLRAVAVEHPMPRSRDQRAGYHLGLFPKNTTELLTLPGPDPSRPVPPAAKSAVGVATHTMFARNQRQAHR